MASQGQNPQPLWIRESRTLGTMPRVVNGNFARDQSRQVAPRFVRRDGSALHSRRFAKKLASPRTFIVAMFAARVYEIAE